MCWKCDNPNGTIEDYLDELRRAMRDHGWAVQFVEHDKRPLAYTVGLHSRGLPELLITGLNPRVSTRVLNSIAHMIVDDRFLMEVVEVDHPEVHLKFAVEMCGPDLRALQLVWADNWGRFPWEAGWSQGRRRQPVLGIRAPV